FVPENVHAFAAAALGDVDRAAPNVRPCTQNCTVYRRCSCTSARRNCPWTTHDACTNAFSVATVSLRFAFMTTLRTVGRCCSRLCRRRLHHCARWRLSSTHRCAAVHCLADDKPTTSPSRFRHHDDSAGALLVGVRRGAVVDRLEPRGAVREAVNCTIA